MNHYNDKMDKSRIIYMLMKKFEDFCDVPNRKQIIKIDCISDGLKPYFLDKTKQRIKLPKMPDDADQMDDNTLLWQVSFIKIINIWPQIEQIHFLNWYIFDDIALKKLIQIIKMNNNKLKHVKFLYYDYKGKISDYPFFFNPNNLSKHLLDELQIKHKWKISFSENCNGYRINLRQHRCK